MTSSDETCARARELLPRRLDGDLVSQDEVWVSGHLEGCGSCRDEAAALERAARALRELPPEERARLRERTYRELGLADPPRPSRLSRALLFALVFLAVYFWLRARGPSPVRPVDPGGASTR